MNKVIKAIRYATTIHNGQTRKNGFTPFVTHPIAVACKVAMLDNVTEDMVVAALLHDGPEDVPSITFDDIRNEFGPNVANLVEELTNVYTSSAYPKMNRKERKLKELERLKKISPAAKQIKMLDRIHNLEERGLASQHMRKNYLPESRELAHGVGDANPTLYKELLDLIDFIEKENFV